MAAMRTHIRHSDIEEGLRSVEDVYLRTLEMRRFQSVTKIVCIRTERQLRNLFKIVKAYAKHARNPYPEFVTDNNEFTNSTEALAREILERRRVGMQLLMLQEREPSPGKEQKKCP